MDENLIHIIACILSSFLLFTIIVLNIVTILALRRTLMLPRNFKTLLLSLAVSDAGVGLLVQPLYIVNHAMMIERNRVVNISQAIYATQHTYLVIMNLLCVASFLGVTALTADRFLAIQLHLRYEELVTCKRVAGGVISIWVFSAFISLLVLWNRKITLILIEIVLMVSLIVTGLFYLKIYLTVKHQTNQIIFLQTPRGEQNSEELTLNARRQKKAATMTFGVFLVLVACYLPNMTIIGMKMVSKSAKLSLSLQLVTDVLVFLNSCLNPLIYCWKMKHIRYAAMEIVRTIFSGLF